VGSGFKSRGVHENPVSSHESWVFLAFEPSHLEIKSPISVKTD
jgi:2-oxoglutarate dehydrogenase complex dehydrogenase (E1) component-like enzyme